MNQILIGIILVLGIGGYFIYQENVTLKANNLALEGAVEEQKQAFEIMKADFELQGQALQNQQGVSHWNHYNWVFYCSCCFIIFTDKFFTTYKFYNLEDIII